MSRAERSEKVTEIKAALGEVRHAILIDFRGITVPQVTELRAQVRKGGGHYAVVKNTLLGRAVSDSPLGRLKSHLKGPTAVIWSDQVPVQIAKTIVAFRKTVPVVQVKAVLLDGEELGAAALDVVASLPGKEELRGRLVSLLASPLVRLATALSGPARGFASVVRQKADRTAE